MSWADIKADANEHILDAFREDVLCVLPSGDARGIFEEYPDEIDPITSEVGVDTPISQQLSPTLTISEADATGLKRLDPITVSGRSWLLSSLDPDGEGLVTLYLMPADADDIATPPDGSRWR